MSHSVAMARVSPHAGHNVTTTPRLPGTTLPSDAVPLARIYRPARSTTTSAPRWRPWIVEFERRDRPAIEPLMAWTSQADPLASVRLTFRDLGSALDFVHAQGWSCELHDPAPRRVTPKQRSERPYRDRLALSALCRSIAREA